VFEEWRKCQKIIVGYLYSKGDKTAFQQASSQLQVSCFEEDYRLLWGMLIAYNKETSSLLNFSMARNFLRGKSVSEKRIFELEEVLTEAIESAGDVDAGGFSWFLGRMREIYRRIKFVELSEKGLGVLEKEGFTPAKEYLLSSLGSLEGGYLDTAPDGRIEQEVEEFLYEVSHAKDVRRGSAIDLGFPSLDSEILGLRGGDVLLIAGWTGSGKCHAKGTKIIMSNGSVKEVENIKVGDCVLGVDGRLKRVIRVGRGRGQLYKIVPNRRNKKNESFIVNADHILSLKRNKKYALLNTYWGVKVGEVKDISVKDFLRHSEGFRKSFSLYKTGVDFEERSVPIEPYFLGIWLGDGNKNNAGITTQEKEIIDYLYAYAKRLGLSVTETKQKSRTGRFSIVKKGGHNRKLTETQERELVRLRDCGLTCAQLGDNFGISSSGALVVYRRWKKEGYTAGLSCRLRNLGVLENKHIPDSYKINSRKNRLELLAGLIDSDGSVTGKGGVSYEFYNTNERLVDDVVFLCRSLGFAVTKKKRIVDTNFKKGCVYYRLYIGGDVKDIPTKVKRKRAVSRKGKYDALLHRFKIEEVGVGDYFGFELDGSPYYLLDTFFVNHNTTTCIGIAVNVAMEQKKNVVFITTETIRSQLRRRIFSRMTKLSALRPSPPVSSRAMKSGELAKAEAETLVKLKEYLKSSSHGALMVAQAPTNATMSWLRGRLLQYETMFRVDVVILDDIRNMLPYPRRQKEYEEIGQLLRDLKKIAVTHAGRGVPVISPYHISREEYKKALENKTKPYTLAGMASSSEAERLSDVIISLWQKEDVPNDIRVDILKMRDGRAGRRYEFRAEFDYQYLYEVSIESLDEVDF